MSKNQIIPFDDGMKLPAHLQNLGADDDWVSGQVAGFPVMSIKSKVFHIHRGEEKTLVARKDDPDEPASNISVVVIRTHKGVARTYYATQYEEGSAEKPDCYSNDGVTPADDAEDPQCKSCATCPHAQWGSRITEAGKKGKACSEVKRLAIAAPGQINDPMLLRVPPTSLRGWDQYVDLLRKRGVTPAQVVTKIGFDHTVSHQLLTFKAMGFITEEMADQIMQERDADTVKSIIGIGPNAGPPSDPVGPAKAADRDEDAPPAKAAKPKATKPKPAPEPDDGDEDGEEEQEEEAPKPRRRRTTTAKPKPAPEPEPDDGEEDGVKGDGAAEEEEEDSLMAELEKELDGLGFGDDD